MDRRKRRIPLQHGRSHRPCCDSESRARAQALLGVEDKLSIETEPFMQWVIEENFVSGRPAWEAGGAVFANAVEPYEKMKLRLLNARTR